MMDPEPTTALPTADLLAGRYRLGQELARGGIGVVHLAHDEQMDSRPVVIKVLLERSEGSEWLQKKFRDEMRALVRIDHPGIVGVLDAGTLPNGRSFLVMQYVRGDTLRQRLQSGPLPLAQAADIAQQIGRALSAAHAVGVYHRDLKPENVMVQEAGPGQRLVKIIDFGIATVKEATEAATRATAVAGTPSYMAPEQLAGRPGAASDTYALGVIAYEMLTGRLPFVTRSPYELLSAQRAGLQHPPREFRPDLPAGCDALLRRALAYGPEERPASASELGDALARLLSEPSPGGSAEISTVVAPGPSRPLRRHARIGAILAALVAVAALAIGWQRARDGPAAIPAAAHTPPRQPVLSRQQQPERRLTYSITVQKYRSGRPYRDPFRLPGEMLFGPDDRVRLELVPGESGHLYVVNEGPAPRAGARSYNVLFPRSGGGEEAPGRVAGGASIAIPEQGYFVFDEEQGRESLWICWAAAPVPELEAVKRLANPQDRGVVREVAQIEALRGFFERSPRAGVVRDEKAGNTVVSASGDALVTLIKLEHH